MISRRGERGRKRRLTGRGSEESKKLEADGDVLEEEDHCDLGIFPRVYIVDVVDRAEACGDLRLDSLRLVVLGIAADLLDMASWLGEERTCEDDDGCRP